MLPPVPPVPPRLIAKQGLALPFRLLKPQKGRGAETPKWLEGLWLFSERCTCPHTTACARRRERRLKILLLWKWWIAPASVWKSLVVTLVIEIVTSNCSNGIYTKFSTDAVTPQNCFIGGVDIKQELWRCLWSKSLCLLSNGGSRSQTGPKGQLAEAKWARHQLCRLEGGGCWWILSRALPTAFYPHSKLPRPPVLLSQLPYHAGEIQFEIWTNKDYNSKEINLITCTNTLLLTYTRALDCFHAPF